MHPEKGKHIKVIFTQAFALKRGRQCQGWHAAVSMSQPSLAAPSLLQPSGLALGALEYSDLLKTLWLSPVACNKRRYLPYPEALIVLLTSVGSLTFPVLTSPLLQSQIRCWSSWTKVSCPSSTLTLSTPAPPARQGPPSVPKEQLAVRAGLAWSCPGLLWCCGFGISENSVPS